MSASTLQAQIDSSPFVSSDPLRISSSTSPLSSTTGLSPSNGESISPSSSSSTTNNHPFHYSQPAPTFATTMAAEVVSMPMYHHPHQQQQLHHQLHTPQYQQQQHLYHSNPPSTSTNAIGLEGIPRGITGESSSSGTISSLNDPTKIVPSTADSTTSSSSSSSSAIGGNRFTPQSDEDGHDPNDSYSQQHVSDDMDDPNSIYDPFRVKHRRRTTPQQLKVLEHHFEVNSKPDVNMRKALSDQLEMTPREVQVWFQNRRAKVKKLKERAEKDGSDPNMIGRESSDDSSMGGHYIYTAGDYQQYQTHHQQPIYTPNPHIYQQLPIGHSLAPNHADLSVGSVPEYEYDLSQRRGSYAASVYSTTTDGYHDSSNMPPSSSAGVVYNSVSAPLQNGLLHSQPQYSNGVYQPTQLATGYPTPASINTPSHSPHDLVKMNAAGEYVTNTNNVVNDQIYVSGQQQQTGADRRFSVSSNQFVPTSSAFASNYVPYATPPVDVQQQPQYREQGYPDQSRDDEEFAESPEDPADAYSFTAHAQPSTTSFQSPLDPLANGSQISLPIHSGLPESSRINDRRGSFPHLNQAFDTLNFNNGPNSSSTSISTNGTAMAAATTSPTRIGGIAAPQWPTGPSSRMSYAAPSFAPPTSAEYVYGSSPIATPPVNYFPLRHGPGAASSGAGGRRGSLVSIPERGGFIDPASTMGSTASPTSAVTPNDASAGNWANGGALSERRGSNASIARKARSNNSLRAPYPAPDSMRNRSPSAQPNGQFTAASAAPGVDARVVPDGLQYVLPTPLPDSNAVVTAVEQP